MEKQDKLVQTPMLRLVLEMAWPLMVSLLVQSLYNIVDSVFVAMLGEDALTAISLAYPVQIMMIAVSVGTSVGVNSLLSRSIGAGDTNQTGNIATTGVLLSLTGMGVFTAFGFVGSGWLAHHFTSNTAIAADCKDYLRICMMLCGGTFIGTMYQRFLQAVGDTLSSMVTLIAGAVTNLILDPVLIFGLLKCPSMGVRGAAIATVIGQWVTAALAVWLNKVKNPRVRVSRKGFRLRADTVKNIYKVGLPTILMQAMGSVMVVAINAVLMSASSTGVAFFGVYYKLQSFLFMPMNGLGQAAIPIAGYNYGAKKYDRVCALLRTILPLAVGIGIVTSVIFLAFPGRLLAIFGAGEAMRSIGVPALRIISGTFAFASATMVLGYLVSGLGNGTVNMVGTALRQLVLLVPLVYLLERTVGIGAVWFAFWPAEVLAAIYAAFASHRCLKRTGVLNR